MAEGDEVVVDSAHEDEHTGTENDIASGSSSNGKRTFPFPDLANASVEGDENYFPPPKKFEVISEEKENEWLMTEDMAQFVKKYFNTYVKETDLHSSIMKENPVPSNMTGPAKLDNYLRSLLEEQKKQSCILVDKSQIKLQQKIINVMGPLGKAWSLLQNALSGSSDRVEVHMGYLNELLEQSILLIGQINNSVNYNRRVNILSHVVKESSVKQLLKDKSELLSQGHDELFGPKFKEDWYSGMKTKQKCQDLLKKEQKPYHRPPFRGSPSNRGFAGSGGRGFLVRNNANTTSNYGYGSGKRFFASSDSRVPSTVSSRLKFGASYDKKSFSKYHSHSKTGGKVAILCKELGKINPRSTSSGDGERIPDSLSNSTRAGQSTNCSSYERGRTSSFESRGLRVVEEKCYTQNKTVKRAVYKQSVCYKEERGWKPACDKSEGSKYFHSIPTLQNGGFTFTEGPSSGRRFSLQDRFEGCLSVHPSGSSLQKVSEVSVGRHTVRVPMPLLRAGSSPLHFHQTSENPNVNSEKNKHQNHSVFGRHVINVQNNCGLKTSTTDIDFSVTKPRLCDKLKKSLN